MHPVIASHRRYHYCVSLRRAIRTFVTRMGHRIGSYPQRQCNIETGTIIFHFEFIHAFPIPDLPGHHLHDMHRLYGFRQILSHPGRRRGRLNDRLEILSWLCILPDDHVPMFIRCVGCCAQVLVMAAFPQLFDLIGLLSPANHGVPLTALLSLWVLASSVSGCLSSRI